MRLTSVLASRDTVIGGALQVDRFEVAAGRTVTLSGDLALRAEGPVVIEGTLRGDCRGVDIVSLQTVTVRGTIDNTCSSVSAAGKPLRVVAGAEYTLDSATVFSSGSILVTNDTTLTAATSALGTRQVAALRLRSNAAAPCMNSGRIGLGIKQPNGAPGIPSGANGDSHRATIAALGGLAWIHWRMRNIAAAQRLQRDVATRYAQVPGDEHAQTTLARARLCEFLLSGGNAIAEAQRNCALAEAAQRTGPPDSRQAAWLSGLRLAQAHIALGTTAAADSIFAQLRPALDTLPR